MANAMSFATFLQSPKFNVFYRLSKFLTTRGDPEIYGDHVNSVFVYVWKITMGPTPLRLAS